MIRKMSKNFPDNKKKNLKKFFLRNNKLKNKNIYNIRSYNTYICMKFNDTRGVKYQQHLI